MGCLFRRTFKILSVSLLAFASSGVQANSQLGSQQVIDMTSASDLSGDMVVTTGFLHNLDVVAFEEPTLSVASNDIFSAGTEPSGSGWAGVVEVEMDEDLMLPYQDVSSFSDSFAGTDRETRMSGFYTMRYQFETDLPFRPYAGAGLGLVATDSNAQVGGVIAGRATAGFDFTVGEDSAVFAEYAFVKSGGVNLGASADSSASSSAIPDTEHSLKFGFRRTF
jgi:hypothetical protein